MSIEIGKAQIIMQNYLILISVDFNFIDHTNIQQELWRIKICFNWEKYTIEK